MGKIWDRITKKEPESPATPKEIEQLKLEVQKAKLQSELGKLKGSKPKSGLAKLWNIIHDETPERRKARHDNIKRGLDI